MEEGGFCTRAKSGLHVNPSQGRLSMSMRARRCLCGHGTPVILLQNRCLCATGQPGHDEDGQMVVLLDRDRYLDFMHWQLRHIADVVKRTGGPEPDAAPVSGGNREVHSCA